MTEEKDFMVFLSSNVKGEGNTESNFTTQMAHPFHLNGDWRVSLKEIVLPNFLYNVFSPMNRVMVRLNTLSKGTFEGTFEVDEGSYTPEEFVAKFNDHLQSVTLINKESGSLDRFVGKLKYDVSSKRMGLNLEQGERIYIGQGRLRVMMGLDVEHGAWVCCPRPERGTGTVMFPNVANFSIFTRSIYVYSNIVNYSQVGDVRAPILRIVHLNTAQDKGETIWRSYTDQMDFPLHTNIIRDIQVKLADSQGTEITFRGGNVTLSLQFTKVKR